MKLDRKETFFIRKKSTIGEVYEKNQIMVIYSSLGCYGAIGCFHSVDGYPFGR
jgi:hypothetical protein